MSREEQQQVKTAYYNEAIRYMDNAKENLAKAGKKDDYFYRDKKYVKTACGIAYNAVLLAVDGFLLLKGIEKKKGRKSIEYYYEALSNIDKKLLSTLELAYRDLHLEGYYDGTLNRKGVKRGFDEAYYIIDKIKPMMGISNG